MKTMMTLKSLIALASAAFLLTAPGARAQDTEPKDAEGDSEQEAADTPAPILRGPEVRLDNVTVSPRDAKTAVVTFDITWTNAYRYGSFHDATWVFFKARAKGSVDWRPVRLAADQVVNPTGYSCGDGTPLEFVVPAGNDPATGLGAGGAVGMFVRLAKDGRASVAARKVTAVVELNTEHGTLNTSVRAFGIEMCYVGEGPYFLGTGGKEANAFHAYVDGESGAATPPYRVTGTGAIPTGKQKGKLWASGITPENNSEISALFPNGFAAFYCMKYPVINQALYAGFLNTIPAEVAKKYWYDGYQGVTINRVGSGHPYTYVATTPDGFCPWLSWRDCATVAAWAGLRPLTELEYEKALRGSENPTPREVGFSYWGLGFLNSLSYVERLVTPCLPTGRTFAGSHGQGEAFLPADWPKDAGAVVYRGGYGKGMHYYGLGHLLNSGRIKATVAYADRRGLDPINGFRAVRTAPAGDNITATQPPRFDATIVRPLRKLAAPFKVNDDLSTLNKPLATMASAEDVFPENARSVVPNQPRTLWQGPEDVSARIYLGWDGEAVCIGAEVTDDQHQNTQSGGNTWNGDAMQLGVVPPDGTHWNLMLALSTNGVIVHQSMGASDAILRTADCAVTRDENTKLTRYTLRLPLTALGLKAGDTFGFNAMICDGDSDNRMDYYLRMAQGVSFPFRTELYPRFVLKE